MMYEPTRRGFRLRAEKISDEAERDRAIADINDMILLLDDALLASRAGAGELAEEISHAALHSLLLATIQTPSADSCTLAPIRTQINGRDAAMWDESDLHTALSRLSFPEA